WECTTHEKYSVDECCHPSYVATIHERIKGMNCPICRKRQGLLLLRNLDSVLDCNCPILAEEGKDLVKYARPDLWRQLMKAKDENSKIDKNFEETAIYLLPGSKKKYFWGCLNHTTCDEH